MNYATIKDIESKANHVNVMRIDTFENKLMKLKAFNPEYHKIIFWDTRAQAVDYKINQSVGL